MYRRHFLAQSAAVAACALISHAAVIGRAPRIVLRSSWRTRNIGDIGHTPGVLALLENYIPEAEVTLWPHKVGDGVDQMLMKRFPKLVITEDPEQIRTGDFFLHGSGAYLAAAKDVAQWRQDTGKPYGIYGITMAAEGDPAMKLMKNNGLDATIRDLMNGASFVFLRDGVSLQVVKDAGVTCPIIEFGPDGAFGVDVRNDELGLAFMKANGLEERKFLCTIPHLRHDPFWRMNSIIPFNAVKHQENEKMKEHDHKPLRDSIIAVVRETGLKVLVCPEDSTQMETGRELLFDPLPEEIKKNVVWRKDFWLTDEALSVYARSAGMFSNEMHSPIMCIGNGIPAIVCRFKEQTSKGFMWRDIGLKDWLFDLDNEDDIKRLLPTVLAMAKDPTTAFATAAKGKAFVNQRQRETMNVLRTALT
jgi:polysaccharide pyruvyl transferase WcaK-like protein